MQGRMRGTSRPAASRQGVLWKALCPIRYDSPNVFRILVTLSFVLARSTLGMFPGSLCSGAFFLCLNRKVKLSTQSWDGSFADRLQVFRSHYLVPKKNAPKLLERITSKKPSKREPQTAATTERHIPRRSAVCKITSRAVCAEQYRRFNKLHF